MHQQRARTSIELNHYTHRTYRWLPFLLIANVMLSYRAMEKKRNIMCTCAGKKQRRKKSHTKHIVKRQKLCLFTFANADLPIRIKGKRRE